MFIENIKIQNFKAFRETPEINFKDRFTVLIGDNATGKTSLLHAIRAILYVMLPKLTKANYGQDYSKQQFYGVKGVLSWNDIHTNIDEEAGFRPLWPCKIQAEGDKISWEIYRINKKGGCRTANSRSAISYMNSLLSKVTARNTSITSRNDNVTLPLIAYYGTERAEIHNKRFNKQYHPWDGYKNCLGLTISNVNFIEWYRDLQKLSEQSSTRSIYEPLMQTFIEVLRDCFIKERIWDLHYYDKIYNSETGKYELVNDIVVERECDSRMERVLMKNLSAGYKIMLTLVADIIMRCLTLNPHLTRNAAKETSGIVLIDEIDMHLHPLWQRHIVSDLMRCFPKIQFIATTHSPFIVQSLKREQIINLTGGKVNKNPSEANIDISIRYMGVENVYGAEFNEQVTLAKKFYQILRQENVDADEVKRIHNEYVQRYGDDATLLARLSLKETMNFEKTN